MTTEISKSFGFEAAHLLPNVAPGHKCGRLHGHSFRATIHIAGEPGAESGWIRDFADLGEAWQPIADQLDHHYLNDIPGLENPTSELLAAWIWDHLIDTLPDLTRVVVSETCTTACEYRG
ncbi:MAG TPA: 6-carboxytetrahydropterin synthase QueD [Acidimicrobiales bacterium]